MGQLDLFEEEGVVLLDLFDKQPAIDMRDKLFRELRNFCQKRQQKIICLENYHKVIGEDDEWHTQIQAHLTGKLREELWHLPIFQKNAALFRDLIGLDLDIEIEPYLRIVRPGNPEDNIGFHRDTIYGGSPHELSVFVPLVDLDANATLRFERGSHLKSEAETLFKQIDSPNPQITKGSIKHKLGFLYRPKVLSESYPQERLHPIPVLFGQVIAFSLAILHGNVVNQSQVTRWSCDLRVKNAFLKDPLRDQRFMPLTRGPVTRAAQRYLEANKVLPDLADHSRF